jgi:hypothetical protein
MVGSLLCESCGIKGTDGVERKDKEVCHVSQEVTRDDHWHCWVDNSRKVSPRVTVLSDEHHEGDPFVLVPGELEAAVLDRDLHVA